MTTASAYFSIIIPTRDRAELFKLALDSVLEQSFEDKEVIVVNDGSTGASLDAYKALEAVYPTVTFLYLPNRPNGHGQSYAMNYGVSHSSGQYIGFLDDDDYWTDPAHLSRAYASLSAQPDVELYYTNQKAFFSDGSENTNHVWLDYLDDQLAGKPTDSEMSTEVDVPFLLTSPGFAHLNCSIFKRDLFECIKGLDENIRYENDRDVFIRSIDSAHKILFNPAYVSRHHIPNLNNASNMSTIVSANQKRLYQLQIYDKGALFASKAAIREFCMVGKGWVMKAIAEDFAANGDFRLASWYARQALAALPSVKWRLYCYYLRLRNLLG